MSNKNYYLLTFNEDYADEHDVPALACMTAKEYKEWLETSSGDIDPEYDEKFANFKEACKKYDEYITARSKAARDKTNESMEIAKKLIAPYINSIHDEPKKINSHIYANLGNNGEGFSDSFQHLYLMKEFVDKGIVKVISVDKSFYKIFHKANLSKLSLCNVFKIKEQ